MSSSIQSFKVDGLAAATFTPYKADGSVDYDGVDAHCKDLAAHGVRFAFSASRSRRALAPGRRASAPTHLARPLFLSPPPLLQSMARLATR